MRLTKTNVDRLKPPVPVPPATKAQAFYRDDILRGFAVRVTSTGAKSFIVETKVSGKTRRKTLGKYPNLTVEQARKLAQERLGQIAAGRDPEAEQRDTVARSVTLAEVFAAYLAARKTLKVTTVTKYQEVMRRCFNDWQSKPLINLSKDMVERRHRRLGEDHGEGYANLAMRVLRAVFNFAAARYEDSHGRSVFPENPVRRLSATRAWYSERRRTNVIKAHQLKPWFQAVQSLAGNNDGTVRDYLLLVLFTGLRRREASRLTWNRVDFADRTLTVTDTKNHHDHTLPLSDFLLELLQRRKATASTDFVFPGPGVGGYLKEPSSQIAKVRAASGVYFSIHDLRRTYATIAESLDIPAYALKRLLNHKSNADVTAGYIVTDVQRLRKPMQQVTDFILKSVGVKRTADVVEFRSEAHS